MFEVQLSTQARQFYNDAQRPLAKKLNRCFELLEMNPRQHNNIKKLHGPFAGFLRFRIGDWRVVYRIDDEKKLVQVLEINHRRNVYE